MKNLPLLIGTILGTLLLIAGIAFFFSKDLATSEQPVDEAALLAGATNTRGSESPLVTIVEFSDFQCPACAASQPLVTAVMQEFGDQVRLVYRHFPLEQTHPYARTAAIASEIVAEQNQFWQFHDVLFARQATWSKLGSVEEVQTTLAQYAAELGLDEAAFTAKIQESSVYSTLVQNDVELGSKVQVTATPTFFVNGQRATAPQLRDLVTSVVKARSTE
ncbi:MAG: hypothetical protein A3A82_04030 [Candidatus Pacebacteria bacterium RIFCSPLOWO2_01_FULL_47_12]|nr:MAG: hypothetical protein A3J60_02410 [Candidatus Pacebacteria bacterium RIFCSPHIGHO2_02_FULL_46_9]OGJ39355.1 MAG: hypothetical protein A3A82_04030 [Candidatus Pacebacteria bacterium RIFCSPLOWO2_01_FULL_47_12]